MVLAKDVPWLLDCYPRPVQQEAILRSFFGWRNRDKLSDQIVEDRINSGQCSRGFGLWMEMRTGKTPTVLNEFMLANKMGMVNQLLVICPNRFKHTWVDEAKKFGVPCLSHVFYSSMRRFAKLWIGERHDLKMLVINYEALGSGANRELFEKYITPRTYIAADESVNIKNHKSLRYRYAMALSKPALIVRTLTGFPAPQSPADLWSQLRFSRQIPEWRFYPFKHRFVRLGGWRGKQSVGARNVLQLDRLIKNCTFRARRGDWSTNLGCDYETVALFLRPEQEVPYVTMERHYLANVGGNVISVDMAISKLMKLQQICSSFLLENGKTHHVMPFNKTPKFEDLYERLSTMIQGKTIVIAHYNTTVKGLFKYLKKFDPALVSGDHHMRSEGRTVADEVDRFNNSPSCRVMVAQGQAVKYGFTLMGNAEDPCTTIVFFENTYNLDTRVQCEERPQGVGQKSPIYVVDYISGGVEKAIIKALQRKKSISRAIMGYIKEKDSERRSEGK